MATAASAAAQTALLSTFTSGAKGLAPASGGGTTNFLRADGTWTAPTASVADGDKGDVIVSGAGTAWALDYTAVNAVVAPTWANVSGKPSTFAPSAHTHPASEISDSTTAGRALLTAADAAAQRSSLGLGNSATLDTGTTAGTVAAGDHTHADLRAVYYGVLTGDYTLANSASAQKAFNWSTNGALTLPTGYYRFKAMLQITGMSATSGNAQFQLLGSGTATVANIFYHGNGIDNANPLAAGTRTGSFSTTSNSAASIATAGTSTALGIEISGVFNVTATGTIIPSVALVTAVAAVMKAGSFFHCERIGATGSNTSSGWT